MASAQQAKNIIDANILDTFTLFIEILMWYISKHLPLFWVEWICRSDLGFENSGDPI